MSDAPGLLFSLAVVAVPGVVGAMLITRLLPGLRALGAFVLWLPVPFVLLAMALQANIDPTLSQSQQTYNFQLAFVLGSVALAVPWLPANLVGALIGRRMRKRNSALQPTAMASPPADPNLPDWRHADNPSLSLGELGARMHEIAARAGIPDRVLPHVGPIAASEGEFIDRDKFDYIYIGLERGAPMFDHRVVVADQLMYLIFRDRAWMIAAGYVAGVTTPPEQDPERIAEKQQEILAGIDPRWGRQFALERARKAGG